MKQFREIIETIDSKELTKQLEVYKGEFDDVLKKKYKNNVEVGIACGTCLRCLRFIRADSDINELMLYLDELFELENLVDTYNERTYYKVDVESKINRFVTVHKQKVTSLLNWFGSLVKDDDYGGSVFLIEGLVEE